jgi:nucleoside-diphosphate-sugar epimerase
MRIFLAGATGAIGRRLLPLLRRAGHEVTGMTRSETRAEELRAEGVEPVVGDALDADRLRTVVAEARPEVVVHQLTQIPLDYNPRKHAKQFEMTDRLRSEGTPNLARAAVEAGARRIVSQSIAFAYPSAGSRVKAEDDPLNLGADEPWRRSVHALRDLEDATMNTEGLEGVVLRYGFFYGPGTGYAADGVLGEMIRRRRFPIVGDGTGVHSFIHIDDAAGATVKALDGPPGIYNVVDDEPAQVATWLPELADALGAKPPRRVPRFIGRLAGGRRAVDVMNEQRGASNAKARAELGWEPRYPSWRQGFREGLG